MHYVSFFFFFLREFQFIASISDSAFYHHTKTLIGFWCRWGLNPKSLIQPSEILPIELTGTYCALCILKSLIEIINKTVFLIYTLYISNCLACLENQLFCETLSKNCFLNYP